ncbi:MAG: Succinate dehydrogenase iron-sulfur protein, partial [uncultured Acidimicrobiales bacterium]
GSDHGAERGRAVRAHRRGGPDPGRADDRLAEGEAVQPRDRRQAALAGVRGRRRRGHRPGARRAAPGEVVPGRDAHVPPVVRPRRLRLRRHGHQRGERPRLPAADPGGGHVDHPRGDPGAAGHQGPRGRHGAVLRPVPLRAAVPHHERRARLQGAPPDGGGPGAVRRHDQVHPVRGVHHVVPRVLGQLVLRGSCGNRAGPPLHLRLARRGLRRPPRHPQREVGCVAVPHGVQLLQRVPPGHQGHPRHRRGEAGHPLRPGL